MSLTYRAVSTFSRSGLELYGRRMAYSFDAHWPVEVGLTLYAEGWADPPVERANVLDLEASSPWLAGFKMRHARRVANSYRMDAVRFAHKVAAVCHAAQHMDVDVLIWIDGDVVTHAPITLADLDGLAPMGDEWIAWLDRATLYPECGFYMLNMRHSLHGDMIRRMQSMYADDRLFGLPEWHDSFVLQVVVDEARIGTKTLSRGAHTTLHPMINGPLGQWFDHLKGIRRKGVGRSSLQDLCAPREEAHWRTG